MSVNRENLVLYGIKTGNPYEFVSSNDVDEYDIANDKRIKHVLEDVKNYCDIPSNYSYKKNSELVIINDGMNGDYSIIGILVENAGDMEEGDGDFNTLLHESNLVKLKRDFMSKLKDEAPSVYSSFDKYENFSGVIVITHYT
jgi:hypothetical protein